MIGSRRWPRIDEPVLRDTDLLPGTSGSAASIGPGQVVSSVATVSEMWFAITFWPLEGFYTLQSSDGAFWKSPAFFGQSAQQMARTIRIRLVLLVVMLSGTPPVWAPGNVDVAMRFFNAGGAYCFRIALCEAASRRGGVPPPTDFILWLTSRPTAEWAGTFMGRADLVKEGST